MKEHLFDCAKLIYTNEGATFRRTNLKPGQAVLLNDKFEMLDAFGSGTGGGKKKKAAEKKSKD